jgi:hypothetical protein
LIALRVVQTLSGSKLALSTNTGAYIAPSQIYGIIAWDDMLYCPDQIFASGIISPMIGKPGMREYHPELISRKGELIAWGTGLLVVIGWMILKLSDRSVTKAIPFLAVFLILSGCAISLGNWMDRHTSLAFDEDAIEYHNGLRSVRALWMEINEVRVTLSQWGKKSCAWVECIIHFAP